MDLARERARSVSSVHMSVCLSCGCPENSQKQTPPQNSIRRRADVPTSFSITNYLSDTYHSLTSLSILSLSP